MSKRIFSILTPTFNRAHTLHRVFESINKQTMKKINEEYCFEWIVIDDGSTDETGDLIRKWQKKVDWPIHYIYQENKGKPWALKLGLRYVNSELTFIADSDDAFSPHTFKTIYCVWNSLNEQERKECAEISVLCCDQFGNRIGKDFPREGLLPALPNVLKWKSIGLGETWAAIKTENLIWAFNQIPDEIENIKFIPESFFWDLILFKKSSKRYFLNETLRIYYKENAESLSLNIRKKYPESFCFESKYFITHYPKVIFLAPIVWIKHFIKAVLFCSKFYRNLILKFL